MCASLGTGISISSSQASYIILTDLLLSKIQQKHQSRFEKEVNSIHDMECKPDFYNKCAKYDRAKSVHWFCFSLKRKNCVLRGFSVYNYEAIWIPFFG